MPKYPHGSDKTDSKGYTGKEKRAMRIYTPKNFLGAGATSEDSGVTPNETGPMGFNYGICHKNKMGRMRNGSVGYLPASKAQLGTPPTKVA